MTPRVRPWILAAAALAAIVAAYAAGTLRAPVREVRTVEVQRSTRVELRERTDAASSTAERTVTVQGPVRTVWRTAPAAAPNCPAVSVVEEVRGAVEETKVSESLLAVRSGKEALTSATVASVSSKTVERGPEWWGVSGGALRFKDAHVAVTGSFELRPIKALPFFVVAQGLFTPSNRDWGAGVALKLTGR